MTTKSDRLIEQFRGRPSLTHWTLSDMHVTNNQGGRGSRPYGRTGARNKLLR